MALALLLLCTTLTVAASPDGGSHASSHNNKREGSEEARAARVEGSLVTKSAFFNETHLCDRWGQLNDMRKREKAEMDKFDEWLERHTRTPTHPYSDGEWIDAVSNFFWGQRDGIVLEMGAVDGSVSTSVSLAMEDLGWHRVLIEGNPKLAKRLKETAPQSLAFSTAVCERAHRVHYIQVMHLNTQTRTHARTNSK